MSGHRVVAAKNYSASVRGVADHSLNLHLVLFKDVEYCVGDTLRIINYVVAKALTEEIKK